MGGGWVLKRTISEKGERGATLVKALVKKWEDESV